MDICLQNERNMSAWQAVTLIFLKLFKEKLILASDTTECPRVQLPKELTPEALTIIFLMAIFIILALMGSTSTGFQYFFEQNTERKKPKKNIDNNNVSYNMFKKRKRNISNYYVKNKKCTIIMQKNPKKCISFHKDILRNSRSFLQCFCFIKNGKQLFQTDADKEQFECFHGIRVISNISILCFHFCMFNIYTIRVDELKPFLLTPISKLLYNASFGVDAFFVLSGFLNVWSFLKLFDKRNGNICWWQFYLKRFLRLTPAYMIVLGFYTTLLCYTGSGPIWPWYRTNPVCKENWWRYLLYLNNFELSAKSCMVWCWHLAAEVQIFVLSPIFMFSLLRWERFGYCLASITIFLSGLSGFLITKHSNLIYCSFVQLDLHIDDFLPIMDKILFYFDKLYFKPYTRIGSYLIGVLLGYYLDSENSKDTKKSWITLWFGWIAAGIMIWISFFSLLNREESAFEAALYNGVKHQFFSVALSWIIFFCLTEKASLMNAFLSSKLFIPFSKLSYCAYLIHVLILQRDYQAAQELKTFSILSMVLYAFRVYFWTLFFSVPVFLLFEMPIRKLFDLYVEKKDKPVKKRETIKKK